MKTLIELYDERPLENILATEVFRPERTVFLASPEVAENEALIEAMRAFLEGRGIGSRLLMQKVDMNDPQAVAETLQAIQKRYEDCALDICGGTDAALFAGGLFAAGHELPVFTYSRRKGRFFNLQGAPYAEVDTGFVRFSVEDFLRMAGGSMRRGRVDNDLLSQYMWMMEPFFSAFLAGRKSWNQTVGYIQAASQGEQSLNVEALPELKAGRERVRVNPETLERLQQIGLIKGLSLGGKVCFTFADKQIRTWLRDVGSVLELYIYKTCLDTGLFNDVKTSVIVDWAGQQEQDGVSNEIDVVASRGLTPFFISCKTSEVKTEALNELAVLRDRFGGEMARAAIVTAENANAAVRNRAAELRIGVIDLADLTAGAAGKRINEMILGI